MNFATDLTTDEQWKSEIEASTGTVQGHRQLLLLPSTAACDSEGHNMQNLVRSH